MIESSQDLFSDYNYYLLKLEDILKKKPVYPIISLELRNSNENILGISNSTGIIYNYLPEYKDLYLKTFSYLSFLPPNLQQNQFFSNLILYKLYYEDYNTYGVYEKLIAEIEEFSAKIQRISDLSFDFDSFFKVISLDDLVFALIPSFHSTDEISILRQLYHYIIQELEKYSTISVLRKPYSTLNAKLNELLRLKSIKEYKEYKNQIDISVLPFQAQYLSFNFHVAFISIYFDKHIDSKILKAISSHPFTAQTVLNNHFLTFFQFIPTQSLENITDFFKRLKNKNRIRDYDILLKSNHESMIRFNENLNDRTDFREIFPFHTQNLQNTTYDIQEIISRIDENTNKDENQEIWGILILILSQNLMNILNFHTVNKFLSFFKEGIENFPIFSRLKFITKDLNHYSESSPILSKIVETGLYPKHAEYREIRRILEGLRRKIQSIYPISKNIISQKLIQLIQSRNIIPILPRSLFLLFNFYPEITNIRILTRTESYLIENYLFFFDKYTYRDLKTQKDSFLYDLRLDSRYFSVIVYYLMKNAQQIYIKGFSYSFNSDRTYFLSYFDFENKQYRYDWYNQKWNELESAFTEAQKRKASIKFSEFGSTITPEFNKTDFFQTLKHIEQFKIPEFYRLPKDIWIPLNLFRIKNSPIACPLLHFLPIRTLNY